MLLPEECISLNLRKTKNWTVQVNNNKFHSFSTESGSFNHIVVYSDYSLKDNVILHTQWRKGGGGERERTSICLYSSFFPSEIFSDSSFSFITASDFELLNTLNPSTGSTNQATRTKPNVSWLAYGNLKAKSFLFLFKKGHKIVKITSNCCLPLPLLHTNCIHLHLSASIFVQRFNWMFSFFFLLNSYCNRTKIRLIG